MMIPLRVTVRPLISRLAAGAILAGAIAASPAGADEGATHVHGTHEHGPIHFSHPLITESPSPDTKLRFDHFYRRIHDSEEQAREHTVRLEAEYAFHPTFSVEVDVPVTFRDAAGAAPEENLDTVEIGLKLANFVFAEYGVLLGYGVELGLPTGDDAEEIGSDHIFEVEPFLDAGFKRGGLEIVSFASFGIPTNQAEGEEVENELGFNASALYHVTPFLMGLVELDGETVLNGDASGQTVAAVTPGIKIRPLREVELEVGAGVSFPITGREEFEIRTVFSVFYHF